VDDFRDARFARWFSPLISWLGRNIIQGCQSGGKKRFFTIDNEEFEIQLYRFNFNFNCKNVLDRVFFLCYKKQNFWLVYLLKKLHIYLVIDLEHQVWDSSWFSSVVKHRLGGGKMSIPFGGKRRRTLPRRRQCGKIYVIEVVI
jgi:hypothetical protein